MTPEKVNRQFVRRYALRVARTGDPLTGRDIREVAINFVIRNGLHPCLSRKIQEQLEVLVDRNHFRLADTIFRPTTVEEREEYLARKRREWLRERRERRLAAIRRRNKEVATNQEQLALIRQKSKINEKDSGEMFRRKAWPEMYA